MKKLKNNNVQNLKKVTRKSGISLIVLVITIIVILILAAAVIITLNNNNPIAEANKARYESDRANMQAVFTLAVGKVMTQNRATISVTPGKINLQMNGVKESSGEVGYTVTNAMNIDNSTGTIVFDKGTNTVTTFYTGKKLPIYAAGDTKWYVDEEGNILLEVAGVRYGEGEFVTLQGAGQTYYTLAPSTLSFRSTADLSEFKEVQINGQTVDESNYTLTEGSTIVTLSVDYLKTLDVAKHEITVVSESGSPSAEFEIIEPKLNEYGFYYNQPYTSDATPTGEIYVFFLRDDKTLDLLEVNSTYSELCNYVINDNIISVETSMGTFSSEIISNTEFFCKELNISFTLGNDSIFADEDYIYFYEDDTLGLEVNVINKDKKSYSAVKNNINGIPVTSIERAFVDCVNMEKIPDLPDTVTRIEETFAGCTKIESATIPLGVTAIGDGAFSCCVNLKEIRIHENVTAFYSAAFSGCESLNSIIFEGTIAQWNNISKNDNWNLDIPATEVKCSDGVIVL